jgi:hypothetical protein
MTWMPVMLVGLFLVRGVAGFIESYCSNWVAGRVVLDLREAMFRKFMVLPVDFYDDQVSGNLVSKVTFDVTQVTSAATSAVTISLKDSLTIAGLLGWLFYLNWKLTLVTLVVVPGITLIVRLISKPPAARRPRSPGRHGRDDAGAPGGHRLPEGREDLRRRALRDGPLPRCRRSRAPLHDEVRGRGGREHVDRAAHRRDGARDHHHRRRAAVGRERDHRRRIRVVHHGDADAAPAAQAPDRRERAAPARTRSGREHLRAARPRAGARPRHRDAAARERRAALRGRHEALRPRRACCAERHLAAHPRRGDDRPRRVRPAGARRRSRTSSRGSTSRRTDASSSTVTI